MKKSLLLIILSLTLGITAYAQENNAPVDTTAVLKAAHEAANAWLALIDDVQYTASWDSAGVAFKAAVTPDAWETALSQARSPFGSFGERVLVSATYAADPPNAPPGEYVIHAFSVVTENATVIETVAMTKESDGSWRAGGYFVRPS